MAFFDQMPSFAAVVASLDLEHPEGDVAVVVVVVVTAGVVPGFVETADVL